MRAIYGNWDCGRRFLLRSVTEIMQPSLPPSLLDLPPYGFIGLFRSTLKARGNLRQKYKSYDMVREDDCCEAGILTARHNVACTLWQGTMLVWVFHGFPML